jgi:hypothetical protein
LRAPTTQVEVALDAVLTVAREALADHPPGRVLHVPGTQAVWDDCCAGQLWVRLTGMTPIRAGVKCLGWRGRIEVGIVRCVAVMNDDGTAPSVDQINADARRSYEDTEALRAALDEQDWIRSIEEWVPQSATGGCGGGAWIVTVEIPNG